MDGFDDDISGVQMSPEDVYLIVQSVRFSERYWKDVLEQNPDDDEAIMMNRAFDSLIEKIDVLEEFSTYIIEDEDEEQEPPALPNNVLNFPGVEISEG